VSIRTRPEVEATELSTEGARACVISVRQGFDPRLSHSGTTCSTPVHSGVRRLPELRRPPEHRRLPEYRRLDRHDSRGHRTSVSMVTFTPHASPSSPSFEVYTYHLMLIIRSIPDFIQLLIPLLDVLLFPIVFSTCTSTCFLLISFTLY
jgi:hypothetical protein